METNTGIWFGTISALFASVIGGFISGYFSSKATKDAHKNSLEKLEIQTEKTKSGLLQAIHDEVEVLWESYEKGMGRQIEALDKNQPLLFIYPITQDYFSIYTGNASSIGLIDDHDLRKIIISTYSKAKALIDSYRMNKMPF